ncbi:MAG: hypothetical protein C3F15_13045 [Holophagae bacterium]|nr:MAG: hypothetical protein C3F15_13045 [Holophagae bacterium]
MAVITFTLLLGTGAGFAQTIPGLDDVRKGLDMISVQKLLEGKPALTTSLEDAVTEVEFLDGFEPADWAPLSLQPRATGGEFRVAGGGAYAMEVESYCLRAGSHAPGSGTGYLYAPAKGPRAAIVRNVLHRAQANPQIEQSQIQVLLWAILSRSKVSDMSGDLLSTAKALLTPEEIYQVNGGALGLVPSEVLDQAVRKAPPLLGKALEAEAKVRDLVTEGDATYEQVERAAVIAGEAPVGEGSREVPRGRWSYHPAGYYIRYMPYGYPQTVVWVYAPERFTVETDSFGRVTSLAGPNGWRMALDYGDATPAVVAGKTGVTVQRIHSVSMELTVDQPQRMTLPMDSWQVQGWLFLDSAPGGSPATMAASELPGVADRSRRAAAVRQEVDRLCDVTSASLTSAEQLQRIAALGNLRMALQNLELGSGDAPPAVDPVEFVTRAWASELGRALTGRSAGATQHASVSSRPPQTVAGSPRGSGEFVLASWVVPAAAPAPEEQSDEDYYTMDLSDGVGQPGNTANQREGISNRGTRRNDECAGAYAACRDSADRDYLGDSADCITPGGDPFASNPDWRECARAARRQNRIDLQGCATIARHCLGL